MNQLTLEDLSLERQFATHEVCSRINRIENLEVLRDHAKVLIKTAVLHEASAQKLYNSSLDRELELIDLLVQKNQEIMELRVLLLQFSSFISGQGN